MDEATEGMTSESTELNMPDDVGGEIAQNSEGQLEQDTGPSKKKISFVIDGQTYEEELTEEDLIKGYQHSKAASKKFQESAQMRKQSEAFLKMLKENPAAVLKEIGMDPRDWAENYLVEQLADQMMDPKDRELRDTKKQLEAIENERKKVQEQQQAQVYSQLVEHYQQDFEKQIIDNLNSSGLPRTEHTVSRMAYYMGKALDAGLTEVTFADIVPLVRSDYEKEVQSLFSTSDIEKLINLVGEEPMKKIRNYDVNRVRGTGVPTGGKSTPKINTGSTSSGKITQDEFRQRVADRVNQLAAKGK